MFKSLISCYDTLNMCTTFQSLAINMCTRSGDAGKAYLFIFYFYVQKKNIYIPSLRVQHWELHSHITL